VDIKALSIVAAILLLPLGFLKLGKSSLFISDALAQAETNPDPEIKQTLQMMQMFQKGVQQYNQGRLGESLETLQQAMDISQTIGNRYFEGNILFAIGAVHRDLDQYALALESLDQALAIYKELDFTNPANRYNIGMILKQMGDIYNSFGQYTKALESYQLSLKNAKEFGVKGDEGNSLNSIGLTYTKLRQPRKALESFQQTFAIFQQMGDRAKQGTILANIASAYMSLGQASKALEFRQQALAIQKEVGDRPGEAISLNNLGVIYGYLGQRSKALEFYQQALALLNETAAATGTNSFPSANKSLFLSNIGLSYLALGQYEKATKALFDSIEIKEFLRIGLKDIDKVSIFETQADTYSQLQNVLITQNKVDTALEIAERSRARAFVELLARRFSTPSTKLTINPPSIEKIKQIAKEQNATLVEYSIIEDIFNIQSLEQFQESELFIWVIKPNGEVAFRKADLKPLWQQHNTTLVDLVSKSRRQLNRTSRRLQGVNRIGQAQPSPGTQQLHQLLIEPIADLLPTDPEARVIFLPQGALFLVPFAALQDTKGNYLIEKHTILTAPAIQVLDLTHQRRQYVPGTAKDVLLVGNPTMPSVPPKLGEKPEALPQLPNADTKLQSNVESRAESN
jgi:tetratricopeptide (TPR) repeat protein